jgi:hypothetical protein
VQFEMHVSILYIFAVRLTPTHNLEEGKRITSNFLGRIKLQFCLTDFLIATGDTEINENIEGSEEGNNI